MPITPKLGEGEAEAGGSLGFASQLREPKATAGLVRPCLKKYGEMIEEDI